MRQRTFSWKSVLLLLFFIPLGLQAQNVKGTVTDAETNEPLIGVSVKSIDGKGMAVTDFDGKYTIQAGKNERLQFSYIGYLLKTVPVGNKSTINVALAPDVQTLNDVVVIGYGTQKKADLTGAVGVVDMKEAQKTAATNIYEMLQGQVPGISVSTTSQPGVMSKVQIRGVGSFNTVGPLYVIDGMIANDANHLNPNEIETMQVLKDASAAAIYGARGANGVILITTKRGKKGEPSLDVTATWSVSDMPKKIEMMSATDFMKYNEQAYINAGEQWPAANYAQTMIGQYIPSTDWQAAKFQTGFTQDYNVMYRQGSDNVNMAIGGGYMDQTGVIDGPDYRRFTARINSDATYGILKIGENLTFQHTIHHETTGSGFWNALSMPSVIPVRDPNEGSGRGGYGYGGTNFLTYTSNPIGEQERYQDLTVNNRALGNVYAELTLFKHFTYKINFGVDAWFGRHKNFDYGYTLRLNSVETHFTDALYDNRDQRITTILENTLTYQNTFGKHNLTVLAGHTAEDVNWHWLEAIGYDQQVPGLVEIDLAADQHSMSGSEQQRRQLSYLGRIDYSYDGKYLAQFNFRSDGSSKFGPNNRRGYFPSFSLGWRVSEEKFFEPLKKTINNLKVRASWGKVGDMQSLGNYSYIPSIDHSGPYEGFYAIFGPSKNETVLNGATQSAMVNVNLGWETKTTTNIGLDFNMFNNRLFGTFEWFNAKSSDLLLNKPQSWATGVGSIWTNFGEMRNSGIELTLGWRDKAGELDYSVSANVSTVRNEVLRMGESYVMNAYTRTEVGRSVSDFYLIPFDGIFQSMDEVYDHTTTLADGTVKVIQPDAKPGDVRYVDVNGDGLPDVVTIGWSAVNDNRQANVGVLINKGNGSFQNALETGVVGNGDGDYEFALCTVKAYDLNNDGLADFMVQGNIDNRKLVGEGEYASDDAFHPQTSGGKKVSRTFAVYMNMTEDGEVGFYDMELANGISHHYGNGNFAVADFNNDGTPDLFVTGESPDDAVNGWAYFPQLLIGKITAGEVSYTDNSNFVARGKDVRPLNSTNTGVRAIDYNGDGLYDLFLLGWCEQMLDGSLIEEGEHKGEPLKTQAGWFLPGSANGLTSYQRIPGASEQGIFFLDYGVEGALNYTFTGYHGDASYFPGGEGGFPGGRSMVFTKNPWDKAARPAAPTAPQAEVNDNAVTLSWTPAATAQKNVTYEYFIKDASGKIYNGATSFIGGDKDGVRKVLREGNAFMNTTLALNNIPAGEYTWGVQTIAADLQGSTFATGSFTVTKELSGINNMTEKTAVANIFTVDGKRVAAQQKGINIVKMTNGEVRKVIK